MKNILNILLISMLVGCSGIPFVKTQVVPVDKPIALVPKPPIVPKCDFLVDTLQILDINDPGKVGQYYKHDMLCLRKTNGIYQQILDQYQQSSQNFDKINQQINELVKITPPSSISNPSK